MKPYDKLKDKLAWFGGCKWLPYVDAVELVEENERLKQANQKHIEVVTKYSIENQRLKGQVEGLLKANEKQSNKIKELSIKLGRNK